MYEGLVSTGSRSTTLTGWPVGRRGEGLGDGRLAPEPPPGAPPGK